jgi:hypothetical protein
MEASQHKAAGECCGKTSLDRKRERKRERIE